MKIRLGFISNSSSSSFVIITPQDFDPFKEFENIDEQEFMRKCFKPCNKTILGQKASVYEMHSYDDLWEYESELFDKLIKIFRENKECYINEVDG